MGFLPILSLKVALSVMCSEKVQEKYRCKCTCYLYLSLVKNLQINRKLYRCKTECALKIIARFPKALM